MFSTSRARARRIIPVRAAAALIYAAAVVSSPLAHRGEWPRITQVADPADAGHGHAFHAPAVCAMCSAGQIQSIPIRDAGLRTAVARVEPDAERPVEPPRASPPRPNPARASPSPLDT